MSGLDLSQDATYYWRVISFDGSLNSSDFSSVRTFTYANYTITFRLIDSTTNNTISTVGGNSISIKCDSVGLNTGSINQNPFTTADIFPPGDHSCDFTATDYFDRTQFITAINGEINISMSLERSLTVEEHNWLEAIYDCLINENCNALNLLKEINITTTDIWQKVTKTNRAVITNENVTSYTLGSGSNITIDYTISIPLKDGYEDGELLPLRLYFWFHDNTTCYSQDKQTNSNRAESPFCFPLVSELLGLNNGNVTFTVDLRPNLPEGTYNFTRAIEIDPILEDLFGNKRRTWTNYGQEVIGEITVLEDINDGLMTVSDLVQSKVESKSFSPITIQAVKEIVRTVEGNKIIIILLSLILIVLIFLTVGVYRLKK